jgi:hypothetical protein
LHARYEEVKAAFQKRFASKKTHSLTKLRAMSMQPGEKVMLWYARILAVGDNIVASDTAGINDPEKLAIIKGQMATLELLLLDQFKRGLRSEIRSQMKAETFSTIEDCAQAAEEAEEFLEATTVQVGHLGYNVEAEICHVAKAANAAFGPVRTMNERVPYGTGKGSDGRKVRVTAETVVCFRCQGKHFVRDCPEPPPPYNGQKQGGKFHKKSDTNSRSGSKDRKDRSSNNVLSEQLDRLTSQLGKLCGRKSRSERRSRSTSRSSRRSSSRSRSSSRRSRSGSRDRSRSSSRGDKRVNHSSKSKKSSKKNSKNQ